MFKFLVKGASIIKKPTIINNFQKKYSRNLSLIPVVLESSAGGERSFDIYSRLLRERIICVHGEISDQMASVVTYERMI